MKIPFVGGSYSGRSSDINAQRSINWFPTVDQERGKVVVAMYPTPGLLKHTDFGSDLEARQLYSLNGTLYAVMNGTLYAGTTSKGTLLTTSGNVWMEDDDTNIMLTDGTYGYVYNGTTLSQITDTDFPTPSALTYLDGYFIVSQADSARVYYSTNPASWGGLDYTTKAGASDYMVAPFSDHKLLWLFGEKTTEIFYATGSGDEPFIRMTGGFMETGCAAAASIVKEDERLFWLSDDRQFVTNEGFRAIKISTNQIDYQISKYTTVSDAKAYSYVQEGESFYVVNFPSEEKTWCYNISNGFWHERASYPRYDRHRSNCAVLHSGETIVGDYDNGKLYTFDMDKYTDDGEPILMKRTSLVIHDEQITMDFRGGIEIEFESGVGLVTGQGSDPKVMLRWSDDGARTWSNEHWRSVGKVGKYRTRAIWRKLGNSKNRVFELTASDPVKLVIINAFLREPSLEDA